MATIFKTSDSKVAYNCRKAQRIQSDVTVTIPARGGPKQITGRVLDVELAPNASGELVWEITIAENRRT